MIKSEDLTFPKIKEKINKAGNLFYQYRACRRDAATIYDIENIRHGVVYARTPLQMINEGTVYFDVRFNAVAPGDSDPIILIINLEIQMKEKPGYELVTRGIYYCARMISEQYGTVFTNEHYEKIQKVYSIWICPSTAQCRQNGINRYHTIETPVMGYASAKREDYDLMEVVILNLGDASSETQSGILDFLNTLFSSEVTPEEKKKTLSEKYSIAMTADLEREVQRMCNLSSVIENKARDEGIDIGELKTTVKYYRKGKLTLEEAAKDLNMTVEEFTEKMNQFPAEAV